MEESAPSCFGMVISQHRLRLTASSPASTSGVESAGSPSLQRRFLIWQSAGWPNQAAVGSTGQTHTAMQGTARVATRRLASQMIPEQLKIKA